MPPAAPTTNRTGDLIRRGREWRGWSQTKLGKLLEEATGDGSQTAVSDYETGGRLPDSDAAHALDRLLGMRGELARTAHEEHAEHVPALPDELANLPVAPWELIRVSGIRRLIDPFICLLAPAQALA